MKRNLLSSAIIVAIMALGLTGCDDKKAETETPPPANSQPAAPAPEAPVAKAEAKRARNKAATTESVNNMAHTKTKKMNNPKSKDEQEILENKIENVRKQNSNAKEGSLASKADLVRKFNEVNK